MLYMANTLPTTAPDQAVPILRPRFTFPTEEHRRPVAQRECLFDIQFRIVSTMLMSC
jgi:hypothetical protein